MVIRFVIALALLLAASASLRAADAPLVYLRDADPTIVQDMRYATKDNFTGFRVPGYLAGECMLLKPVAEMLKRAQATLAERGLSLKVYDCYRPQKAVDAFVAWAKSDARGVPRFFPRVPKSELLKKGYIEPVSNHSRGIAVDVTLVVAGGAAAKAFDPLATYGGCISPAAMRAPDNSLDMGTGFDCFDDLSATNSGGITPPQKKLRGALYQVMVKHGFKNYPGEWWHYSLTGAEKAPVQNVDIAAYPVKKP
ncbi:MAG: M15 family metallopeptidase [Alphaproteobacteria bacterium]|nr:M15 family metallopeptidase [Alphaproteobacteria bacterium]